MAAVEDSRAVAETGVAEWVRRPMTLVANVLTRYECAASDEVDRAYGMTTGGAPLAGVPSPRVPDLSSSHGACSNWTQAEQAWALAGAIGALERRSSRAQRQKKWKWSVEKAEEDYHGHVVQGSSTVRAEERERVPERWWTVQRGISWQAKTVAVHHPSPLHEARKEAAVRKVHVATIDIGRQHTTTQTDPNDQ
jgi:hypothetical protein